MATDPTDHAAWDVSGSPRQSVDPTRPIPEPQPDGPPVTEEVLRDLLEQPPLGRVTRDG